METPQERINAQYPGMVHPGSSNPAGFALPPGWVGLVLNLCSTVRKLWPRAVLAEAMEADGVLRVSLAHPDLLDEPLSKRSLRRNMRRYRAALVACAEAEQQSLRTCIGCGAPGAIRRPAPSASVSLPTIPASR